MTRRRGPSSSPILCFLYVLFVQFLGGLSIDPSNSKETAKPEIHGSSRGGGGLNILIICFGAVVFVGLCVLLYKLWQKKKREEQHARLLRLFEEDDELEVELGFRE